MFKKLIVLIHQTVLQLIIEECVKWLLKKLRIRERLLNFLMWCVKKLSGKQPPNLRELEADLKTVKGIGEKRLEEIMVIIEKHLGV